MPASAMPSSPSASMAGRPTASRPHLAEDAYQGSALFTVAVDGKQLGLAQAVTSLNSSGGSQAFGFNDLLPSGTHDWAVTFQRPLCRHAGNGSQPLPSPELLQGADLS